MAHQRFGSKLVTYHYPCGCIRQGIERRKHVKIKSHVYCGNENCRFDTDKTHTKHKKGKS